MFLSFGVRHSGIHYCSLSWLSCGWCLRSSSPISFQVWALSTAGTSISITWNSKLYMLPLCSQGNVTTLLEGILYPAYGFNFNVFFLINVALNSEIFSYSVRKYITFCTGVQLKLDHFGFNCYVFIPLIRLYCVYWGKTLKNSCSSPYSSAIQCIHLLACGINWRTLAKWFSFRHLLHRFPLAKHFLLSCLYPHSWHSLTGCFFDGHPGFCFHCFTLLTVAFLHAMLSNCTFDISSLVAMSMAFSRVRSEPSFHQSFSFLGSIASNDDSVSNHFIWVDIITSVGEYNRIIKCYQLSWKRKLATVKSFKADVSSVSSSSSFWQRANVSL